MRQLIRSRVFAAGFFLSYGIFFILTMGVFDFTGEGGGVGHTVHGFPFAYYYSSCFGGDYLWYGLVGNVLFGSLVGLLIGLMAAFIDGVVRRPDLVSRFREFRTKWYL